MQTVYGVNPTIGQQTGYGVNPTIGQQTGYGVNPTIEQQTGYGVNPTIGQQTGYGVNPTIGQQTGYGVNPTIGQQTGYGVNPTIGQQTGYGVNPTIGQQTGYGVKIGQQTGYGVNPTIGQQTGYGVNPTIGQQTGYGVNPTIGQQTSYGVNPTIGQQIGYGVNPTIGQQTGYGVNPTTGQQIAPGVYPTKTSFGVYSTIGQQTVHSVYPKPSQQTVAGIYPNTDQQTVRGFYPTPGQQTVPGVYPKTGQQTISSVNPTIGQQTLKSSSQVADMEPTAKTDLSSVDLLLIGNSGNGKSATGNSILDRPEFKRSAASTVASAGSASNIKKADTKIGDKTVNVIDGPSIDDSGNVQPEDLEEIIKAFEISMDLCNYGFTALLIVLKFGNNFSKQEAEAVRVIKSVLGQHVVRDYGVCVITHGDNFENAVEEAEEDGENLIFESWIEEQTGEVKSLFEECSYRCVLFDNMTRDAAKRKHQVQSLLSILPQGKRYSKEEFSQSEEGQQELSMEAKLPKFLKQMQKRVETIREKINQIEREKGDNVDAYKQNMELLVRELQEQKEILQKMGINSPDVESMRLLLSALEVEINLKIKQFVASIEIKERAGNQNRYSLSDPLSHYGAFLENLSTTDAETVTELEARTFLDNFKSKLQQSERISDADIYRSVMISMSERLQILREQVKRVDLDSDWVMSVMVEIAKLRKQTASNIHNNDITKTTPQLRDNVSTKTKPEMTFSLSRQGLAFGTDQKIRSVTFPHLAPSTEIKERDRNQNRSSLGDPKSSYKSSLENQSAAITELEGQDIIHNIRSTVQNSEEIYDGDHYHSAAVTENESREIISSIKTTLKNSENISDADQYRSAMISLSETLLTIRKSFMRFDPESEQTHIFLADIDKLTEKVQSNIQNSFNSKQVTTHGLHRNEAAYAHTEERNPSVKKDAFALASAIKMRVNSWFN